MCPVCKMLLKRHPANRTRGGVSSWFKMKVTEENNLR